MDYCQTTGYCAASDALAALSFEWLFAHEGRMRLLVGCTRDPGQRDAIEATTGGLNRF